MGRCVRRRYTHIAAVTGGGVSHTHGDKGSALCSGGIPPSDRCEAPLGGVLSLALALLLLCQRQTGGEPSQLSVGGGEVSEGQTEIEARRRLDQVAGRE